MKLIQIFAVSVLAVAGAGSAAVAAQPQDIEQDGPYVQRSSGAIFPEQVGDFTRTRIVRFDDSGNDVGVVYEQQTPEGRLLLTTYVYQGGEDREGAKAETCDRHNQDAQQAIADAHSGMSVLYDGEASPVSGVAPDLAHRSTYAFRTKFDGKEQDVKSELRLYCFVRDEWMVKYRVTAPSAVDLAPVEQFVRTGPWPSR